MRCFLEKKAKLLFVWWRLWAVAGEGRRGSVMGTMAEVNYPKGRSLPK